MKHRRSRKSGGGNYEDCIAHYNKEGKSRGYADEEIQSHINSICAQYKVKVTPPTVSEIKQGTQLPESNIVEDVYQRCVEHYNKEGKSRGYADEEIQSHINNICAQYKVTPPPISEINQLQKSISEIGEEKKAVTESELNQTVEVLNNYNPNDKGAVSKKKIIIYAIEKVGQVVAMSIIAVILLVAGIPAYITNGLTLVYSIPRLTTILLQAIGYYVYLKIRNRKADILRDEPFKTKFKEFVKKRINFVIDAHKHATEVAADGHY
jgi:hypothetical protein